jgi:hypothetical protein
MAGKQGAHHAAMDQHRVQRVAHRGRLRLGVVDQRDRAGQVGRLVHEQVADADAAIDHRHARVLAHQGLQAAPAAGDDQVDGPLHAQELRHQRPIGRGDQLHRLRRRAGGLTGGAHLIHQDGIGA